MRPLLPTLALAVAGCQPTALQPAGGADALAQSLAGRVAGPAQRCISAPFNDTLRVIDAATVAYEVGPTLWVNRLQRACGSLSPYNTVIVDRSGAQICRGDRVRGVEPGSTIPGLSCSLQDWVPYRSR